MEKFKELLIVLAVQQIYRIVHRDIRPPNVLWLDYCLAIIDHAFCIDADILDFFSGGPHCASPNVTEKLVSFGNRNLSKGEKKLVYTCEDDLFSWLRCWILTTNISLLLSYERIPRDNITANFSFHVQSLWETLLFYPAIEQDPSGQTRMSVGDMWCLITKFPELMYFPSIHRLKGSQKLRNDAIFGETVLNSLYIKMVNVCYNACLYNGKDVGKAQALAKFFNPNVLIVDNTLVDINVGDEYDTLLEIFKNIKKKKINEVKNIGRKLNFLCESEKEKKEL
jgi:hypothetical protein